MATARSQPKPKQMVTNPFGKFVRQSIFYIEKHFLLGLVMNTRHRPALIQATRGATAFTAGLALPGGYTYVINWI